MADKRTRIDDLMARVIRTGERNSASRSNSAGFDPVYELLTNELLRRDPNRVAAKKIQRFLGEREATREAKLGETLGLGDALTFMPAGMATKSLLSREFLPAGVNALAFTSQFDDSKLGQAVGDLTAAFPVFGVGATGRLRQAGERMAKTGKDLPLFSYEGKIAPARQRELEARMRNWIPKLSSKDPGKAMAELDEFVSRNPFWGKYPLEKGPLLDYLPASLRPAFYQSLKEQGYGGIKMGSRDLGALRPDFRPGKETIKPFSSRSWEDILKYEQGGGVPAGWAAANEGRTAPWFTRPGEATPAGQRNFLEDRALSAGAGQQIDPRAKAFLEQLAIGSGIGTAANLATGGVATGDDNLAVVPSWKKLLRKDSLDEASRRLAARKRVEFMPSDIYERAKPDLSKLPGNNGIVDLFTGEGHFYSKPKGGTYELLVNGWPKSGLSVYKPRDNWFDDPKSGKLKVDASSRSNLPAIVKYSEDLSEYNRLRKDVDRRAELARQSRISKGWGAEGPNYPFPDFEDSPQYPQLGDTKLSPAPSDISAASRILGAQFPEFDKIGGFRVSGIRKGPAGMAREKSGMETSVPLRKPSSEENRIKTLADSRRWLHELISNRGSKPAAMTVGGAAAKNPTADYQKIFDYLGDPEDFFRKSRGNLGALGIGAAGAGAAALDSLVSGENPQEGGDNRAGLVVNRRNLGRLAKLQEAAHARLEKIRPAFPEMNYLESVFAAKYPKIYEKSVLASPKNAFNVGLGGASTGSFSPFTSRVTVGIPTSADDWAKSSAIPSIFNTMGHEALHGVDYRRLGKVNHPITGRRLDVGDFVAPIALEYKWAKPELTETLSKIYPDAAAKVANIKPKYDFPGTESDNPFTRLVKDIKYRTSPIEIRARKAGRTSEKTLSNLMDKLISLEE